MIAERLGRVGEYSGFEIWRWVDRVDRPRRVATSADISFRFERNGVSDPRNFATIWEVIDAIDEAIVKSDAFDRDPLRQPPRT